MFCGRDLNKNRKNRSMNGLLTTRVLMKPTKRRRLLGIAHRVSLLNQILKNDRAGN